jgi:hypothetical protein
MAARPGSLSFGKKREVSQSKGSQAEGWDKRQKKQWVEARERADTRVNEEMEEHARKEAAAEEDAVRRSQQEEQDMKDKAKAAAQLEVDERRRRNREQIMMTKLAHQRMQRQTRRASLNTGTLNWYDAKRAWLKLVFAVRGLSTAANKWGDAKSRRNSCHGMNAFSADITPKIHKFLEGKQTNEGGQFRTVDVQFAFAEQRFEISDELFQVHANSSGYMDLEQFFNAIKFAVNQEVNSDIDALVESLGKCDQSKELFKRQMNTLGTDMYRKRNRLKDDVVQGIKQQNSRERLNAKLGRGRRRRKQQAASTLVNDTPQLDPIFRSFRIYDSSKVVNAVESTWAALVVGKAPSMGKSLFMEYFTQASLIFDISSRKCDAATVERAVEKIFAEEEQVWELERQGREAITLPEFADAIYAFTRCWIMRGEEYAPESVTSDVYAGFMRDVCACVLAQDPTLPSRHKVATKNIARAKRMVRDRERIRRAAVVIEAAARRRLVRKKVRTVQEKRAATIAHSIKIRTPKVEEKESERAGEAGEAEQAAQMEGGAHAWVEGCGEQVESTVELGMMVSEADIEAVIGKEARREQVLEQTERKEEEEAEEEESEQTRKNVRLRREAEEQSRRQAEEQARLAEERALRKAEEQALRKAEEQAEMAAEEKEEERQEQELGMQVRQVDIVRAVQGRTMTTSSIDSSKKMSSSAWYSAKWNTQNDNTFDVSSSWVPLSSEASSAGTQIESGRTRSAHVSRTRASSYDTKTMKWGGAGAGAAFISPVRQAGSHYRYNRLHLNRPRVAPRTVAINRPTRAASAHMHVRNGGLTRPMFRARSPSSPTYMSSSQAFETQAQTTTGTIALRLRPPASHPHSAPNEVVNAPAHQRRSSTGAPVRAAAGEPTRYTSASTQHRPIPSPPRNRARSAHATSSTRGAGANASPNHHRRTRQAAGRQFRGHNIVNNSEIQHRKEAKPGTAPSSCWVGPSSRAYVLRGVSVANEDPQPSGPNLLLAGAY